MNTLYRLYTERRANLGRLVSNVFKGFTLIHGTGYYCGLVEDATIIEILVESTTEQRALVYTLAETIRATNAQTAVIVTEQGVYLSTFTGTNNA